jgi:hypothetical protein
MTVVAMAFGMYIAASLNSLVRELLLRAETAPKDEEEKAESKAKSKAKSKGKPKAKPSQADPTAWVFWLIAALVVIGFISARGGLATAAVKIERSMLGLGVIVTGFALLQLVKGAKAIHEELARAPR